MNRSFCKVGMYHVVSSSIYILSINGTFLKKCDRWQSKPRKNVFTLRVLACFIGKLKVSIYLSHSISINLKTNCMFIEQVFNFLFSIYYLDKFTSNYLSFYFASYLFRSQTRFLFYFARFNSFIKRISFLSIWMGKKTNRKYFECECIIYPFLIRLCYNTFCILHK